MSDERIYICPNCQSECSIKEENSKKYLFCVCCLKLTPFTETEDSTLDIPSLLSLPEFKCLPNVLSSAYTQIITLLNEGEVYGALLKTKDVFELTVKLPLVVILSHINNRLNSDSDSDFTTQFSSLHSTLQGFIHDAVAFQLSLGNWVTINGAIKKVGLAKLFPDADSNRCLEPLFNLMQINHKAYNDQDTFHGATIVTWRNKEIGHGALNCNKEEVQTDIIEKLKFLNKILEQSFKYYKQINLTITDDLITVTSADDASSVISATPFMSILSNNSPEEKNSAEELSMFESYNKEKEIGHTINYVNGKKSPSTPLAAILSSINRNLTVATASLIRSNDTNNVTSNRISSATIDILNALESNTFNKGTYFSEWFNECIAHPNGGVFLCCAERGMGKSAFARAIDQINTVKIEKNKPLAQIRANKKYIIRSFHFNAYYNSKTKTFLERLQFIFTNELIKKENIPQLKAINYTDTDLLDIYTLLYTSNSIDERRTLFFKYLKTLLSAWDDSDNPATTKLVLVLDGIDEIAPGIENINIADWIPTPDDFKTNHLKNIYIFITSRCKEEIEANNTICNFLDSDIFTKSLTLSRTSDSYRKEFLDTLKASLSAKNKTNDNKTSSNSIDAKNFAEALEWRYNYLTAYTKIFQSCISPSQCTSEELKAFTRDPFAAYISYLNNLSKTYSHDVQSLLNLLSITNEPLTLAEISYLLTSDNKPTFKLYGMLMDIANFLTIERDPLRGTLFHLTHPDWVNKIEANERLQKNRAELIERFKTAFTALLEQNLDSKDLSSSDYDGETWLLSNIELLDIKITELLAPIIEADFGKYSYQLQRKIRLCEYIISKNNILSLSGKLIAQHIFAHLMLSECYALFNNTEKISFHCAEAIKYSHALKGNTSLKNFYLSHAYGSRARLLSSRNSKEISEDYELAIKYQKKMSSVFVHDGEIHQYKLLSCFYNDQANAFFRSNKPKQALQSYETAITKTKQFLSKCNNNNSFPDYRADLAMMYTNKATLLATEFNDINRSLEDYEKALTIQKYLYGNYKNFDRNNLAITYYNRANATKHTNPTQALNDYDEAIRIRENLSISINNNSIFFDKNDLAMTYIAKATLLPSEQLTDTITYFDKAIEIQKDLYAAYKNGGRFFDGNTLATSYSKKGTLLRASKPQEALIAYDNAINIEEELLATHRKQCNFSVTNLITNYINKASLMPTNQYEKALECYEKALDLLKSPSSKCKKSPEEYYIAAIHFNRASLFASTNDPQKAINDYDEYIQIQESRKKSGKSFDEDRLTLAYNKKEQLLHPTDSSQALKNELKQRLSNNPQFNGFSDLDKERFLIVCLKFRSKFGSLSDEDLYLLLSISHFISRVKGELWKLWQFFRQK